MAETETERPLFSIRKIEPEEPNPTEPPEEPRPVYAAPEGEGEEPTEPPAPLPPATASAGLFTNPHSALTFLGAIAGAGVTDGASCRQAPGGGAHHGAWWIEIEVIPERVGPYVQAAGGRLYEAVADRWLETPTETLWGGDDGVARAQAPVLDVQEWPQIELGDLLAVLPLSPTPLRGWPAVEVVMPGALGRWVLRRASERGLSVQIRTALWRPLRGEGEPRSVLWARFEPHPQSGAPTGERRVVPRSLVEALTNLPYTVVSRPVGPRGGQLSVDVRSRSPTAVTLLDAMIPEEERWILSAGDLGHGRLEMVGEEVDGEELLAPAVAPPATAPDDGTAELPEPLEVRLVADRHSRGSCDAVLLDDDELGWLRTFLMGRPVSERAFLIPGPGHHLLTAPGGLGEALPFGRALTWVGPGGLYVESGLRFYPPLPEGARREVYGLTNGSAVVATENESFRFSGENVIPAWALWAGDAPPAESGLGRRSEHLLSQLSALARSRQSTAEPEMAVTRLPDVDRPALRSEAEEAERSGDLVRAAELLEQAGDLLAAARIYERAALATG